MAEAGVALPAVGVEDPQRRPPPWRAGAVARDDHLRSLADDVAPEPDPRSSGELEADPGGLADGALELAGAARRRLEHDERDPGTPGERRDPGKSIAESSPPGSGGTRGSGGGRRRSPGCLVGRQVDDEQVHRPAREQRAGDRQPLLGIVRGQDDEPLRLDAAGHGLDGIERRGEIQPGDDRARRLRLRDEPQGQRRSPARDVASNGEAHPARHATRPEDGIELREPGRMDPVRVGCRRGGRPEVRRLERHRRERPHDLAGEAGRCRTPARSKGRQRRAQVRGGSGHALSIEQMFE